MSAEHLSRTDQTAAKCSLSTEGVSPVREREEEQADEGLLHITLLVNSGFFFYCGEDFVLKRETL